MGGLLPQHERMDVLQMASWCVAKGGGRVAAGRCHTGCWRLWLVPSRIWSARPITTCDRFARYSTKR